MTIAITPSLASSRSRLGRDRLSRLCLDMTLFMAALGPPTLLALALDERTIAGGSVWAKPLKFELALTVHFATLVALIPLLTPQGLARPALRRVIWLSAAAAIFEIAYIIAQAAHGRASHFNYNTPFESVMYGLMGLGAVVITAGAGVFGGIFTRNAQPNVGQGLRLGVIVGLGGGAAATLVVAGLMSSGMASQGHFVGGVASDAYGLPLLGWTTRGGDLRVPHFFATHAMQALPLAGLAADRFVASRARLVVAIAAGLWFALAVATFVQALAGRPFIAL
jgi:hypothetical protein